MFEVKKIIAHSVKIECIDNGRDRIMKQWMVPSNKIVLKVEMFKQFAAEHHSSSLYSRKALL